MLLRFRCDVGGAHRHLAPTGVPDLLAQFWCFSWDDLASRKQPAACYEILFANIVDLRDDVVCVRDDRRNLSLASQLLQRVEKCDQGQGCEAAKIMMGCLTCCLGRGGRVGLGWSECSSSRVDLTCG